ncbi:hypothetical protein POPTR_001G186075v4 [Populus trichocarpa]|jgi:hypothetical protein|uniref:Uncharacterized protein n=1 Tax=Populus trichocarpa TaxID=3694 RepID=A0ACC0TL09_POPTR|nr:hypothetical protein POPTR_001G186075v4 [Populus trichocarpa]
MVVREFSLSLSLLGHGGNFKNPLSHLPTNHLYQPTDYLDHKLLSMEKIKSIRTTSLLKYTIFSTGRSTATKCLGYNSKFMSPKGQPSFTFGIFANSSGSQMEILERVK